VGVATTSGSSKARRTRLVGGRAPDYTGQVIKEPHAAFPTEQSTDSLIYVVARVTMSRAPDGLLRLTEHDDSLMYLYSRSGGVSGSATRLADLF
jgi:hypothetical protein